MDRQIGLIRLERPDGSLIALAANYAIHGTVLSGTNTLISGDAPGVVTDVPGKDTRRPGAVHQRRRRQCRADLFGVSDAVGGPPVRVPRPARRPHPGGERANCPKAPPTSTLRLDELFVETPLKPGLEWPPELARYSRDRGSGTNARAPAGPLSAV